jgi:hypothetical protein
MELPHYEYRINEVLLDYEFSSVGPKGHIKKIVRFSRIGNHVFNLAFGDLDESTGDIRDTIVSNNNDSRKVLATVAVTIYDFTLHYSGAWIVAKGSNLARTRLYRMGITNHWAEINRDFEIFGLKENKWEPFETRRDYDAFLLRRKQN